MKFVADFMSTKLNMDGIYNIAPLIVMDEMEKEEQKKKNKKVEKVSESSSTKFKYGR